MGLAAGIYPDLDHLHPVQVAAQWVFARLDHEAVRLWA